MPTQPAESPSQQRLPPRPTRILGLSGGIGSGKSTVSRMFEKLGATVIDADAIVHQLQAPGAPLLVEIASAFGAGILDANGALDRPLLAKRVFDDERARAQLGAIVHPPVVAEIARQVDAATRSGAGLVVVDIPLLFESGRATFETTVLVWVPVALQVKRTVARDACTEQEALRRIQAQLPIDEKRALADHVIDNSGTLQQTEKQVRALVDTLALGDAPGEGP